VNVKHFTFTMIMRIRLDLVFFIQRHTAGVSRKDEGYVCVNFVIRKRDSSKTKVRSIKITQMFMLE